MLYLLWIGLDWRVCALMRFVSKDVLRVKAELLLV
jgi:hypothetical protein